MSVIDHPYRVLIVEDERQDWADPMKEALADLAEEKGVINLRIHIAEDKLQAESLLARYGFQVTSLDMRLPERRGELLSVETGVGLARSFPWVGFPKRMVYSQTLRPDLMKEQMHDAAIVLRIPAEQYAKPTGSDADAETSSIETLKVNQWAERIIDSLVIDKRHLPHRPPHEPRLTVVGAYLCYGVEALPPLLAGHLQILANHWDNRPTSELIDAAVNFIEVTTRLALAQSLALCKAQAPPIELPTDDKMVTCLNLLETTRKRLSDWNWSNYLTEATIKALHEGRRERNEKAHSVAMPDPPKHWTVLRPSLQYAMDLACYWVRHPLATDLRYGRDGWSGELLAGTAMVRPRRLLPSAMDFPDEALEGGVWQNVWKLPSDYQGEPVRTTICWNDWLKNAPRSNRQWWFPLYRKGRDSMYMDIISGHIQAMP